MPENQGSIIGLRIVYTSTNDKGYNSRDKATSRWEKLRTTVKVGY